MEELELKKEDQEIDDLTFDDEEPVCPNCGQETEGETTCPNCGAILMEEDDEFNGFHEDDGI